MKNILLALSSIAITLFSAYAVSYWMVYDGTVFCFALYVLFVSLSLGSILLSVFVAIGWFSNLK
jgi:hypothetical protein